MSSRIDEARKLVAALLDDLENGAVSSERAILRAMRVARLMRDSDAQLWLRYEMQGYPDSETFVFSELGSCEKYAELGKRITPATSKYYAQSLPRFEAMMHAREESLKSFPTAPNIPPVIENFLVMKATKEFFDSQLASRQTHQKSYEDAKSIVVSLRSSIHAYATDTYLAIELGDVAEDIYQSARARIDGFVRAYCPKGAEQIVAINDRMAERNTEAWTAALTTCRRLLLSLADALFPAQDEDRTDGSGKPRKVGTENYKNRLLAYIEQATQSRGSTAVITAGLEHLAARLDSIYDKTSKGVHVDVTEEEARLAVINTYLFIGELAAATAG